jgi:Acyl-CoA carboxylase epsilon subunit
MSQGPGEPSAGQARPLLTVVRGEPTAAELAAVTVVIGALAGRASQRPARQREGGSRWAAMDQLVRAPLSAGPGAWRASALPR